MQINSDFYKVTQVKNNLWAIEDVKSNEHTICYLICGTKNALLFDTGLGVSPVLPVVKAITPLQVFVILSHWHFDHSGAASEFQNILGWHSKAMRDISQKGVSKRSIGKLVGKEFLESIKPDTLEVQPFPQIKLIELEQSFDIGGYSFQVLHTPGHTTDSICLYEPNKKWLLTGDTVYPGPLYLQFEDSSINSYRETIQKLTKYEVNDIFPGHNNTHVATDILVDIDKLLKDTGYCSSNYPTLRIKA